MQSFEAGLALRERNKIVRWWTHDSSRRGLQRAFGALAAARADGPRHTPPPLERQLRKSGAVLGSLIVHITTYLECIRARSRSLLPTALKNGRSAHHSCQKTVPTLHANVTFDFSDESRYASAWQGTERTCRVSSRYVKRGARCARQSSRSSFRVRRGKRFVLVYTATPGRPSRTHDCSRFPCLVPRRGPCVSNNKVPRLHPCGEAFGHPSSLCSLTITPDGTNIQNVSRAVPFVRYWESMGKVVREIHSSPTHYCSRL